MGLTDEHTLQDVAERLGVHYQTVYRWVRSGRLTASKVAGAYVVAEADLAVFEAARRSPEPPPSPSRARLDRSRDRMTEALVSGDETTAFGISRELVRSGTTVTQLISSVVVPPLVLIGERWHAGEFGIYVEHRASSIVERLLGELTPNPRGRRRGTAVVAALSGDRHSLPTSMATAALREDRWSVEHLGADIPVDDLIGFVADHDVDLVVVSATGSEAEKRVESAAVAIEAETGVPALVGGGDRSLADLQALARRATSRSSAAR